MILQVSWEVLFFFLLVILFCRLVKCISELKVNGLTSVAMRFVFLHNI